jgi:hypothetical protein
VLYLENCLYKSFRKEEEEKREGILIRERIVFLGRAKIGV